MVLADEKQGFSRRFKEAMRKIRVDADSPTQVAREFNLRYHGDPVLVGQGPHLVATFHPELSEDTKVHALFLSKVICYRGCLG